MFHSLNLETEYMNNNKIWKIFKTFPPEFNKPKTFLQAYLWNQNTNVWNDGNYSILHLSWQFMIHYIYNASHTILAEDPELILVCEGST